ncbi:MAG: AAA family ATPase [Saprospiraceae bacterium]|nr:AAA family ATPase [Saprospiraceae bacterium]
MNKMLKRVTLTNFKKIEDQVYDFTDFDLLVGQNNSGKSTVLQALAIWQYCIDEFGRRPNKKGESGIQIVLPNFTALPLPEFNLLWKNKETQKKGQPYILIEINLEWRGSLGEHLSFGVNLRYQTPQSVYAIPKLGWEKFHELRKSDAYPRILYVPPFSGLEPTEIWYDDAVIRRNVGKAQPGSVLRNLLFRVISKERNGKTISLKENQDWAELKSVMHEWFGVTLNPPEYEKGGTGTDIGVTYSVYGGKEFDIISGGSGFHQVLTLLAFFYGYPGLTTILLDEPDAHMHVNLQRKIIQFFKQKKTVQFLIATHAEEFIKGVNVDSIISVLSNKHKRIESTTEIITALSEIDNLTISQTSQSPYIIYVEGEDDERILRSWAVILKKAEIFAKFHPRIMGGGTKESMKKDSERHFKGLRQINPLVKKLMVFDYDSEETYHPEKNNPAIFEWERKNIENYLLVPNAWKRAILDKLNIDESNQISMPLEDIVDVFFEEQGLSLPKNSTWFDTKANIFEEVNGKKILFDKEDSLFQRIRKVSNLIIDRSTVASNMHHDEIHENVHALFAKLEKLSE